VDKRRRRFAAKLFGRAIWAEGGPEVDGLMACVKALTGERDPMVVVTDEDDKTRTTCLMSEFLVENEETLAGTDSLADVEDLVNLGKGNCVFFGGGAQPTTSVQIEEED
jgi:hypothetical protein